MVARAGRSDTALKGSGPRLPVITAQTRTPRPEFARGASRASLRPQQRVIRACEGERWSVGQPRFTPPNTDESHAEFGPSLPSTLPWFPRGVLDVPEAPKMDHASRAALGARPRRDRPTLRALLRRDVEACSDEVVRRRSGPSAKTLVHDTYTWLVARPRNFNDSQQFFAYLRLLWRGRLKDRSRHAAVACSWR